MKNTKKAKTNKLLVRIRKGEPVLPPDPENMNDDRAAWAGIGLAAFMERTGADREDAPCDLFADLCHWFDRNGHTFAELGQTREATFESELMRGFGHYDEETDGKGKQSAWLYRLEQRGALLREASNILQVFADWEREGGTFPQAGTLWDGDHRQGLTMREVIRDFGSRVAAVL